MSVKAAIAAPASGPSRTARRLLVALLALAAAGLALWLVSLVIGGAAPSPVASPFGAGLREAGPAPGGIGGYLLAVQAEFYRSLTAAISATKRDGSALPLLIGIGFLYGVFHAAGPGHGKAVVAGYLLATRRTLAIGLALSLAAALLQALVAVTLVFVLARLVGATAATISATAGAVEIASFTILVGVGLALLWRKTGALVPAVPGHAHHHHHAHHDHAHHHAHGEACESCGHAHIPTGAEVARLSSLREAAAVVVGAGARPCSGALILLVFATAQGMFAAGVAATFAMALGTAITTGALAALAVLVKRTATSVTSGNTRALAAFEVLAAALVTAVGATLLLGLWTGVAPA
ncbi:nickel/cobalt transporter [uncultured Enterovirga sp.]|uniref:nickel/cobalt transporter n=1 Tax=uncultured Enterovirga sp. TaxID=2026352 RepID=UPI0035CC6CE0